MEALGRHIIAELYDCDRDLINDHDFIEEIMLRAVEQSGATVIRPVFHKFNPHGVSGVVVIAESHFSIHTWPEYGYCALDIFTCGDVINSSVGLSFIRESLKAKNVSVSEMKRGVLNLGVELRHKPDATSALDAQSS
ncbi:MAG: S-adenosylmethionine decarboxylase proenzyme [SAR324 cluster bacterium]|uniref:S-adenosylmethionine decarboxylase proenzyme n=1 Tax=SAR324 cluster bacterium TaxID=2024889 RepID=A0A7X9FS68_9DELT|nr:S-adenosylmethionine decarboxylase proenzyme [SAR324 cluster bacterium]